MSAEKKDSLSHRGNALRLLAKDLQNARFIQEKLISYGMKRTWLQGLGVYQNV